jgi:hypothetical protein
MCDQRHRVAGRPRFFAARNVVAFDKYTALPYNQTSANRPNLALCETGCEAVAVW